MVALNYTVFGFVGLFELQLGTLFLVFVGAIYFISRVVVLIRTESILRKHLSCFVSKTIADC